MGLRDRFLALLRAVTCCFWHKDMKKESDEKEKVDISGKTEETVKHANGLNTDGNSTPFEVCVTHPEIGDRPMPLGVTLETTISDGKASHYIVEVKPGSIGDEMKLKAKMKLIDVCDLRTDGLYSENLQAQFMALKTLKLKLTVVADGSSISESETKIVELQVEKTESKTGLKVKQISQSSPVKSNTRKKYQRQLSVKSVDSIQLKDAQADILFQEPIKVLHPKVMEICHIKHNDSQTYLDVVDNKLVSQPLKIDSEPFQRALIAGLVDMEPVIIFAFREKDVTEYITATSQDTVGLQKFKKELDSKILNTGDTRLFYHHQVADTISSFELTCVADVYLACNKDGEVYLMKVEEENRINTPEIHFSLDYPDTVDGPCCVKVYKFNSDEKS